MRLGHNLIFISFILISFTSLSNCWESYELDLFDLVEEVGQNFYEVFGLNQDCEQSEIKKAYRKLSLLWHPDRSSEPDAETKFRHIVAINDVLKDGEKRARYDQILEHGMPDWRMPIYYFRRVRKLTLYELSIALSLIISIGHYFVLWAQHFEKKLTLEDRMGDIKKKVEKQKAKKKKNLELEEIDAKLQDFYDSLPSPTLKDTLPYRVTVWSCYKLVQLPYFIKDQIALKLSKKKVESDSESEKEEEEELVSNRSNENKKLHLQLNPDKIEKSTINAPTINYEQKPAETKIDDIRKLNREWTDKDKADLIKAIVKFPAGSTNRWNKIGELLGRSAQDCIQMEKQMKSNINASSNSNLNAASFNPKANNVLNHKEEPTISTKYDEEKSEVWSQEQQALLEKALKEFNKDTLNRWDRISDFVPNKTKEDCMNRYKALCSALKKKQQS